MINNKSGYKTIKLELADIPNSIFADFFKSFKKFTRINYYGTHIFFDPDFPLSFLEIKKDNMCLSLFLEDRFYSDPSYTVESMMNYNEPNKNRYFYYGFLEVFVTKDVHVKESVFDINQIVKGCLKIVKDYRKDADEKNKEARENYKKKKLENSLDTDEVSKKSSQSKKSIKKNSSSKKSSSRTTKKQIEKN